MNYGLAAILQSLIEQVELTLFLETATFNLREAIEVPNDIVDFDLLEEKLKNGR